MIRETGERSLPNLLPVLARIIQGFELSCDATAWTWVNCFAFGGSRTARYMEHEHWHGMSAQE
jgi:hypothetical protein